MWVARIGRVDNDEALALQLRLLEARRSGTIPDTLLLLEHPPVITCGRASRPDHLLADEATLARRGVALRETGRGGDVTFHGPGQLVGYPIVDLLPRGRDVHRFLRQLEEGLIRALAGFGIEASRAPDLTGVWVGNEKIAAIGVGVRKWVTYHGFALNVTTDLEYFGLIVPCGLVGRGVTSMAALLGSLPLWEQVSDAVAIEVAGVFEADPVPAVEELAGLGLLRVPAGRS